MRLYHFTNPFHREHIETAGFIDVTESNVSRLVEHAGPDVVWLYDQPESDDSADNGSHIEEFQKHRVLITVEVDDAVRWIDWPPANRMGSGWRKRFITAGGGTINSRHWYVLERRIPREEWVGIETRETR